MIEWIAAASAGLAGWLLARWYPGASVASRGALESDGLAVARARAEELQQLTRENKRLRALVVPPQIEAMRASTNAVQSADRAGLRDALQREVLSMRQTRVACFLDGDCLPTTPATPPEAGAVGVAVHQTVGVRWAEVLVSNALGQTWMVLPLRGALQEELMILQTQGIRPSETLAPRLHLMAGASSELFVGQQGGASVPCPADLSPALAQLWRQFDLRGVTVFEGGRAALEHVDREMRSCSRRMLALALAWPSGPEHVTWLSLRDPKGVWHGLVHVRLPSGSDWLYLNAAQPIGSMAAQAEAALRAHRRNPTAARAPVRRAAVTPQSGTELRPVGVAS